jgi:aminoglycoside phosphotransferase (APT) family kinase protein
VSSAQPELDRFLVEAGLLAAGGTGKWTPLTGGVSSDIWRVEADERVFCVKRALPTLKVAADWTAPVERNATEWEYLLMADRIVPGRVPKPIAHDMSRGLFAMAWLPPDDYPIWKATLLSGKAEIGVAAAVGDLLGQIHSATAGDPAISQRFATDDVFYAIRIEPYLIATSRVHVDVADHLAAIAARTAATRFVLVHGDVSPKNILVGAAGPILLDAECAWYGDPAFDLAFCLNHLAIKARVLEGSRDECAGCFDALADAYFARVDWEPRTNVEGRAAALLPALALARADGKSPLEYLDFSQRSSLSQVARHALIARPERLSHAKALLIPQ